MPDPDVATPDFPPEAFRPVNLDLDLGEQVLRIAWGDGAASALPLPYLRKHCPCAACRANPPKEGTTPLPILGAAPAGELRATGGHLVGNYALRFEWSDGHNTGIYDFRLLRLLDHERSRQ